MRISDYLHIDIRKDDPEAVQKVAREMESQFLLELLKVMRKASGNEAMTGGGGLGGDMYVSMFDMELSRTLAERGLGFRDMLVRGLQKHFQDAVPAPPDGTKGVNGKE